jgi:hypothetical protein
VVAGHIPPCQSQRRSSRRPAGVARIRGRRQRLFGGGAWIRGIQAVVHLATEKPPGHHLRRTQISGKIAPPRSIPRGQAFPVVVRIDYTQRSAGFGPRAAVSCRPTT